MAGKTKIYTYLLSPNDDDDDEVWGARLKYKRKKNVAIRKQRHTTIFMYYAENLHSLRLGFKTFYKWETP